MPQMHQNLDPLFPEGPKSTKERLLLAGFELFSKHGFEATTTRMLSQKTGANNAAVHFHFGSKEALYEAVLNLVAEKAVGYFAPFRQSLEEARSQGPLSAGEAWKFIEAYVDMLIRILQTPAYRDVHNLQRTEQHFPIHGRRPLSEAILTHCESLLSSLLLEYWGSGETHTAIIVSRMCTSALIDLEERSVFVRSALQMPEDDELSESNWQIIREFSLASLRHYQPAR